MFDLEKIKTATSLAFIDFHDQLGSTNDRAIELARQSAQSLPGLVITEQQTSGRGQRDRKWWSTAGSLTFSWMNFVAAVTPGPPHGLTPTGSQQNDLQTSRQLIPAAAALAVAQAIEDVTGLSRIKIKWPNDILIHGKKVAGILIETALTSATPPSDPTGLLREGNQPASPATILIIGIGINVNQAVLSKRELETLADRTEPALLSPTSVLIESGKRTSRNDLLIVVLQQLQRMIDLRESLPTEIRERYQARMAYLGEAIRVQRPGTDDVSGTLVGLAENGGLIVRTVNRVETIISGTIAAV